MGGEKKEGEKKKNPSPVAAFFHISTLNFYSILQEGEDNWAIVFP